MTLLKDNDYKEINIALLSLEADIKKLSNNGGFDTSVIDRQLAEINSRIDKINAGSNNTSAEINDIRTEIENINSKLIGNSVRIENIEQKLSDIFSAENKVTDFNATTDSGVYYWVTDAANRPTDYGVLLVNKYDDGSESNWVNQIAYGTNNKIYFRQNINNSNWTEWKTIAFEGEVNATLTVNGKTYNGSEAVDAGVQTVANGGTGVTTQADINKAFIGNLDIGESDVTDGTEFVSSWASDNGFAETTEGALNKPYKRQFVKVWNYIKDKISSVLGLTANNYGDIQIGNGNATGNKLTIQGLCVSSNSYTDANPKLVFKDDDGSQNISLTFTDYDAVQAPASLTLNGNQGNEYFIAPCIKANNKMRIPIGAPSSLEDGCIWIER